MTAQTPEAFVFGADEVADLAGLSAQQLRRYDGDDFFPATYRDDGPRLYTFRDVVGLRTIAALRNAGVSLQEIRRVSAWLKLEHETPWASLKFWIGPGRKIVFSDPVTGVPLQAGPPPHQALILVALEQVAGEVRARASALRSRTADSIGQIDRFRGEWVVKGTGVSVRAIQHLHEDGRTPREIQNFYRVLTLEDIEAALHHQPTRKAS